MNKSFTRSRLQRLIPSPSTVLCPTLNSSPPFYLPLYHSIKQYKSTRQRAPTSPPTPTLAAIIRGVAVLSPVSSTRPWISRASAGPCRPLSLTLTFLAPYLYPSPLCAPPSACPGLQAHAAAVPASSRFPPCSCCSSSSQPRL